MKKTVFLIPVIAIAAFSCKKTNQSDDPGKSTPIKIDTSVSVTQAPLKLTISKTDGSANYSLLGYGYDVNGVFADSSSVRAQVFNVDALALDHPDLVDLGRSTMGTSYGAYANDAEEFSSDLSSNLTITNGLHAFKGSITDYFTDSNALSSKYMYAVFSIIAQYKRLSVTTSPQTLTSYLSASFKQDVATLSAEALVNKYGTHVLTQLMLGGNLNVLYRAETSLANRRQASIEGLRFAIKRVFAYSTGYIGSIDSTTLATVHSAAIVYRVVGGDQSTIKVTKTSKLTTINTIDWVNSLSENKVGLINIGPKTGLISLDELITDPVKQAAVKAYIATYITANAVKVTN